MQTIGRAASVWLRSCIIFPSVTKYDHLCRIVCAELHTNALLVCVLHENLMLQEKPLTDVLAYPLHLLQYESAVKKTQSLCLNSKHFFCAGNIKL